MKDLKLSLLLILISVFTSSCNKTMSQEELNDKVSSGVVLVFNSYYYSITFPNGEELFFTGIKNGKLVDLTDDEEEIKTESNGSSGTGFFISEDGLILTNRHVARPEVDNEEIKDVLKGLKRYLKNMYSEYMEKVAEEYEQYEGSPSKQAKCVELYNNYKKEREEIDDMDMNEVDVTTHTEIYVAFNDSHIVKLEDLTKCDIVAVSEDERVDLAMIQLKDGETPEGSYIFKLKDNDEELTMDDKLYMIGYNKGLTISKTVQGIRSQIYSGNITQKGDGEKILYSIPSLPGSSGSPVVDEYGNLVAVNFAGFTGTQNFNYGIPSKRIREFLDEN